LSRSWKGRTVLITTGPTREALDPVRYLTNASSGMMGLALAQVARKLGAEVLVVTGPVSVRIPAGVRAYPVTTGLEMYRRAMALSRRADVFIGAAAVSDWRFLRIAKRKIKKNGAPLTLTLVPNPDIIGALGRQARRPGRPLLVGFALETHDWLANAERKLRHKGLDMIVANRVKTMGSARTRFAVLSRRGGTRRFPEMTKLRAAREILRCVDRRLRAEGP